MCSSIIPLSSTKVKVGERERLRGPRMEYNEAMRVQCTCNIELDDDEDDDGASK